MVDSLNRQEQRKAATHQRILDAARDVITEMGYNNVEILHITDRANVSKATFYKHFANKEACVRELMEQGFNALLAQIVQARQDTPDMDAWIVNSLETVFSWAAANREFMLIMVGGAASTELNAFGRSYMAQVTEDTIIQDITHTPRLPVPFVAQIVTGMVIQVMGWWLETEPGYSTRELAEMLRDVMQHGVGPLDVAAPGSTTSQ